MGTVEKTLRFVMLAYVITAVTAAFVYTVWRGALLGDPRAINSYGGQGSYYLDYLRE